MRNIKNFINNKKIVFNIKTSFIILLLGCLFIMAGVIVVNPSYSKIFVKLASQNPVLLILNILPIFALALLIFLIFNNAIFSVMLSGVFFAIMSIANTEKIRLRQDPVFPADIKLVSELAGIAKGFTPKTLAIYGIIIALAIIGIILASLFFKTEKISYKIRAISVFSIIAVGSLINTTIYANEAIYCNFSVDGNPYFEVNQYGSKGFIYSFTHKFNSMKVTPPNEYNKSEILDMENKDIVAVNFSSENSTKKLPHIIMVMGEAYSDLSENENLDFTNYTDPMQEWKTIANSDSSLSGHIIVPKFGGGTSDTEFDVLTALPTRYTGNASNSYNLVRKPIDAIPKRLKYIGYDTVAIHPGYAWFYNRINVYSYMGFDDFIHLESFQGTEKYKGGYIADKYASDKIIETFESHINTSDNPLFEFVVTIQNHGPYDEKYNEVEQTFNSQINLSDKEKTLLNSYFMGIKDADAEIKRLTDYFEESNEPVVFVFFGDHLPGFSNGMEFFDILNYNINANGTIEQLLNVYKTPFMIWQNSASKEYFSLENSSKSVGFNDSSTISANYLGATVLELIGIEGLSPLMDFSNDLRGQLPVITEKNFLLPNGEYITDLDDSLSKKVSTLKNWVYYKMFEE